MAFLHALNVQKDMVDYVKASGSEQEESGGNIPWTVLPGAVFGLASAVYLVNRGKRR
jgi:hypothetical protein